jgi:phenylalanyl-tRNA synthetase beta chain
LHLAQAGYQEVVNFSFVDLQWERDFGVGEDAIKVVNPIAGQYAVMRTNLIGSLVANLKYNLNRKASRVRVFEIARTYCRDATVIGGPLNVRGVRQPLRVGGLAYGPAVEEQWGDGRREVDFFDVKGDLQALAGAALCFEPAVHPALHPGRGARISLRGHPIGFVGELHPRSLQRYELPRAPVVFEVDASALVEGELPAARPVPRFPEVHRDLALWFPDSVSLAQIEAVARQAIREDERASVVKAFHLFDLYRPDVANSSKVAGVGANALLNKEKSLAFQVVLQDTERTLSDAEADAAVTALVEYLSRQLGARRR